MASLVDIFNPSFLMFLGILVLVSALLVVYFESKMREQNHKINSMLSLVSTLAEDANNMKMGLNQLMHYNNTMGGGSLKQDFTQEHLENIREEQLENIREITTKLIEVSDDEESDNEDAASEVSEDEVISEANESVEDLDDDMASLEQYVNEMESEPDSLTESDLEDEPVEQEKITVFKLNVSNDDSNAKNNINDIDDDDIDDLTSELSTSDLEEEKPVLDVSDLKTISINLEESTEKIDYKKLQLPKLRSIIVEKKLATRAEASK
mgnify:CR=1 FL=1